MALVLNLNVICIVCLRDEQNMHSVFNVDVETKLSFAEKIKQCSKLDVQDSEELPQMICMQCTDDLAVAYRFNLRCIEAHELYCNLSKQVEEKECLESDGENVETEEPEATKNSAIIVSEPESVDEIFEGSDFLGNDIEEDKYAGEDDIGIMCMNGEELIAETAANLFNTEEDVSYEFDDKSPLALEQAASEDADYNRDENGEEQSSFEDVKLETHSGDELPHSQSKCSTMKRITVASDLPIIKQNYNYNRKKTETTSGSLRKPRKSTTGQTRPRKICEICGNNYKYQHALDAHMRRHNNDRPFGCEFCEKAFVSNVELRRHIRVHTGQKPYACKFCERSFSDFGSRSKHERTHTGERPYQCTSCDKAFAYAHVLQVHLRTHTGEKKFKCDTCGKGFTKKIYLLSHNEQHMRALQSEKVALQIHNTPKARYDYKKEQASDEEMSEEHLDEVVVMIEPQSVMQLHRAFEQETILIKPERSGSFSE